MIYFLCFVLFSIGLYCILRKRNIIKIIIGIIIAEYAASFNERLKGWLEFTRVSTELQ